MKMIKNPGVVVAVFVWIGFVSAISFMESWLKFLAPGITIPLGLGIGKLVFGALNKVEWLLLLFILISLLTAHENIFNSNYLTLLIPVFIVIVQTFWLLPALDARAQLQISGATVPPSYLHIYFAGAEVIKATCLFIFGISHFKPVKNYE
ncbi:MAG: hypothetical protein JSS90_03905 [Bacteroidetes bacterium]|jgi:hypothetical protein|nr:hypothetical protein [Bacteroidota bacterium]